MPVDFDVQSSIIQDGPRFCVLKGLSDAVLPFFCDPDDLPQTGTCVLRQWPGCQVGTLTGTYKEVAIGVEYYPATIMQRPIIRRQGTIDHRRSFNRLLIIGQPAPANSGISILRQPVQRIPSKPCGLPQIEDQGKAPVILPDHLHLPVEGL